ncbi:unnamed protein product, partial [Durusdinium trenchii]
TSSLFPNRNKKRIEVEVDPDHSLLTQKTLVLGETDQPDDASFQGPNEQQVSSTTIVIHLEDAEKGPLENGGEPGFAPKLPEETPESEPQALKEPEAHDPNHDHPVPEGELPDPAPPSDAGMPSLGAAAGPAEPGPGSISELQAKAAEVMKRTAHINPTEQNKMTAKKNKNKKDEEKEEEEQDSGEDCKPKRKGRKPKEPKEPKAKAKGRAKKQEKKEQEGGKKEPENSTRESKSKGRKDGRDNQKVCKGKEEKETAEEKVRKGKEKDASKDESRKGKGKRTNKQHEQEKEHTAGEKTAVPEGQDQPVAARNGRKKKEYETQEAAQAAAKRSRKCCAYGAEYRKQLEIHGE